MKEELKDHSIADLKDFKQGLQNMFLSYVSAMEEINKKERENVLYTFVQLNKAIDKIMK